MTVLYRTFPNSVGFMLFTAALILQTGCLESAQPRMQAKVLQTGALIADAIIVLTQSKRPFFGSLFSSADPSRCTKLGFAKTDSAGNFQLIPGTFASALITPGIVGLSRAEPIADQGGFVLRQQFLQSSEDSEQFGPEFPSEAQANSARLAFLASAEGQNYTAFTVRPPDPGPDPDPGPGPGPGSGSGIGSGPGPGSGPGSGFKNFRMLVVKYVEVARSGERFSSQAEADSAWRNTAYGIAGEFDAVQALGILAHCQGVKPTQPELGILVLRAIELALPTQKRTPEQADYVREFAKQLGNTAR